jgi:hypothetical protein
MTKEWLDALSIGMSAVAVVFSILAHLRAGQAEQRSLAEAKTNAFLAFRERFSQIKHDLPPKWADGVWLPERNTDEWRRIELYWQNAFDEWFVPMVLNKNHMSDLWDLFFKSAVESALHNRPLRYVAWNLYKAGEFANYKGKYMGVLEDLWGKPLKDSDFKE